MKCGLPLEWLGDGGYREVYRIVGTPYVIKFPLTEWTGLSSKVDWLKRHRIHSQYEMNALMRMRTRRRWQFIRPYLPETLWMDWETGVVVMRYYTSVPSTPSQRKDVRELNDLVKNFAKGNTDIKCKNCGFDENGRLKLIDLGWIEE